MAATGRGRGDDPSGPAARTLAAGHGAGIATGGTSTAGTSSAGCAAAASARWALAAACRARSCSHSCSRAHAWAVTRSCSCRRPRGARPRKPRASRCPRRSRPRGAGRGGRPAGPRSAGKYPVVAPGIAALLALGHTPGQQPAHRVGDDRATGAQLLVQAPDEPVGEHLRGVRTACEALHAGQLAAGGGLHQAAGGRTVQPRPDQVDRSQDGPQTAGGRGTLPRCCLP